MRQFMDGPECGQVREPECGQVREPASESRRDPEFKPALEPQHEPVRDPQHEPVRAKLTELALAYAQRLVRIESVTFRERPCAEELGRILEGLDFEVDIDDNTNLVARLRAKTPGAPAPSSAALGAPAASPASSAAPTAPAASPAPSAAPTAPALLFIGHHDTVELGDLAEWDYPPLEAVVESGKLHGRGSNDEKGGLASFLAAITYMKERGEYPRGDILLVSTREEIADFDQRGILQVLRRAGYTPAANQTAAPERRVAPVHGHDPLTAPGHDLLVEAEHPPAASQNAAAGIPQALHNACACICLEPTGTALMLGHRGRAVADVALRGRAAHASMPARGVNAIAKAAALIAAIQEMPLPGRVDESVHPAESDGARLADTWAATGAASTWPPAADWMGTQAVTTIRGGNTENIVPEECGFTIDRRILDGEDEQTIAAEYQAVIDRLREQDPEFQAEVTIRPPYYAALTDRKEGFVQEMQGICRGMGISDAPQIFSGHTDAEWIINDMRIPCVICGPGDLATAHTSREFVPVEELGICAELYYRMMRRFCR